MPVCPANHEVIYQPELRRTGFLFRQFVALTLFTALDLVRQPISLLLTAACVVLMSFAAMQAFQFGENGKFARDSCLALQFVFGLAAGAYGACTTLSNEIKSGTAQVILSKPVSRELFFAAKFTGLAAFVALFSVCTISATLLSEKASPELYVTDNSAMLLLLCSVPVALGVSALMNYRLDRPFTNTAFWLLLLCLVAGLGLSSLFHGKVSWDSCGHNLANHEECAIHWRLVPAGILVSMSIVVLSATALALATRLSTAPVLAISAGLLLTGLLSDYLLAADGAGAPATICHSIIPDWQHYWMADALISGGIISWTYVIVAGAYASCYLLTVLASGILLFRDRELR
ncbi:MAG: hypothetical protein WCN95_05370 [bacterium]